ncbi:MULTISPECIES: hypothetical protein [Pseudoalteromonas]|uniref:Uncharacterized protein n=1 Tax=Pseudoalteromonas obscura TaxID=3048491 RepID=A0ABT7EN34_9GAMM|nr:MULTISPECIES: hypothetical protein [Pseudoalteromonas]MBQ4839208.1 hypothetical protein [Pseudoalteromonas luteoviolacea]MDK2596464.1 hypothetical protein [Pseudoalteromonas sp. P94(2023)]
MFRVSLFLLVVLFSKITFAKQIDTQVTHVGCHVNNNICYIYIPKVNNSSAIPSSNNCPSRHLDSIRWDTSKIKNADAILAILLAAQATQKKVSIWVPDDSSSCVSGFPTLSFAHIRG